MWLTRSQFTVHGLPAPQGSKRHVGNGRMIESSKNVKPWREAVKWAALEAKTGTPLDGPLALVVDFWLPKPVSAPKNRRSYPDKKPDLSKLLRSTEDALTDAGLIKDDARIVSVSMTKHYAGEATMQPGRYDAPEPMDAPGCRIQVLQWSRE